MYLLHRIHSPAGAGADTGEDRRQEEQEAWHHHLPCKVPSREPVQYRICESVQREKMSVMLRTEYDEEVTKLLEAIGMKP